ncbi:MAG: tetratricopeptide repeat protein [Candidatus Rokuibacteriota bacterium]
MKRRRTVLAVVLALDLCLANACLLAGAVTPAAAQQSEADVFVAQAILAYDARKYDEALAHLKEALAQDPKNVEALYYSGLVLMAQQKTEQAVEALERARALAPRDQSILFLLGVAYFALERYDQAEGPLTAVFGERPQTEGIGYYVGLIRYRKKDYQGALKAFRAETSKNPNIQQLVRFYSGLTLAILGLPEQAVAEVDAALRLQTGSALTGPAERIRDSLASAREAERRFHAEVRFGFLYDTNVTVLPQPSHDPIAEAIRRGKRSTSGELAGLRLDYTWLRTGPWESTVTYSFFQTLNNRSGLSDFDVQNHLVAGALSYRAAIGAMPFQVGTQYSWDYLSLGGDDFLQRHTATVFGTLVENQSHLTTVLGRFQNKDFYATPGQFEDEDRDAQNWMVGFTHVFRFAQDRHYIRIGYQFDYEKAEGRNYAYAGNRFLAGGQYTLPWGSTRLKYDFDLHQRHYLHANTLLPVVNPSTREREDFEQNHVVRVEQVLAKNLGPTSIGCAPTAPCPLTLAAEYQRTVAESNLAIFSYNRNVWSLTLSWQY